MPPRGRSQSISVKKKKDEPEELHVMKRRNSFSFDAHKAEGDFYRIPLRSDSPSLEEQEKHSESDAEQKNDSESDAEKDKLSGSGAEEGKESKKKDSEEGQEKKEEEEKEEQKQGEGQKKKEKEEQEDPLLKDPQLQINVGGDSDEDSDEDLDEDLDEEFGEELKIKGNLLGPQQPRNTLKILQDAFDETAKEFDLQGEKRVSLDQGSKAKLDANVKPAQETGLASVFRFLWKRSTRKRIGFIYTAKDHDDFIRELQSRSKRQQLLIFYLIEREHASQPSMEDIYLSQGYIPNAGTFEDAFKKSRFRITTLFTGKREKWGNLGKALAFADAPETVRQLQLVSQLEAEGDDDLGDSDSNVMKDGIGDGIQSHGISDDEVKKLFSSQPDGNDPMSDISKYRKLQNDYSTNLANIHSSLKRALRLITQLEDPNAANKSEMVESLRIAFGEIGRISRNLSDKASEIAEFQKKILEKAKPGQDEALLMAMLGDGSSRESWGKSGEQIGKGTGNFSAGVKEFNTHYKQLTDAALKSISAFTLQPAVWDKLSEYFKDNLFRGSSWGGKGSMSSDKLSTGATVAPWLGSIGLIMSAIGFGISCANFHNEKEYLTDTEKSMERLALADTGIRLISTTGSMLFKTLNQTLKAFHSTAVESAVSVAGAVTSVITIATSTAGAVHAYKKKAATEALQERLKNWTPAERTTSMLADTDSAIGLLRGAVKIYLSENAKEAGKEGGSDSESLQIKKCRDDYEDIKNVIDSTDKEKLQLYGEGHEKLGERLPLLIHRLMTLANHLKKTTAQDFRDPSDRILPIRDQNDLSDHSGQEAGKDRRREEPAFESKNLKSAEADLNKALELLELWESAANAAFETEKKKKETELEQQAQLRQQAERHPGQPGSTSMLIPAPEGDQQVSAAKKQLQQRMQQKLQESNRSFYEKAGPEMSKFIQDAVDINTEAGNTLTAMENYQFKWYNRQKNIDKIKSGLRTQRDCYGELTEQHNASTVRAAKRVMMLKDKSVANMPSEMLSVMDELHGVMSKYVIMAAELRRLAGIVNGSKRLISAAENFERDVRKFLTDENKLTLRYRTEENALKKASAPEEKGSKNKEVGAKSKREKHMLSMTASSMQRNYRLDFGYKTEDAVSEGAFLTLTLFSGGTLLVILPWVKLIERGIRELSKNADVRDVKRRLLDEYIHFDEIYRKYEYSPEIKSNPNMRKLSRDQAADMIRSYAAARLGWPSISSCYSYITSELAEYIYERAFFTADHHKILAKEQNRYFYQTKMYRDVIGILGLELVYPSRDNEEPRPPKEMIARKLAVKG